MLNHVDFMPSWVFEVLNISLSVTWLENIQL